MPSRLVVAGQLLGKPRFVYIQSYLARSLAPHHLTLRVLSLSRRLILQVLSPVGESQLSEVLLGDQGLARGMVDVQKRLKVLKLIRLAQGLFGAKGQRNAIALRELDNQFGLQPSMCICSSAFGALAAWSVRTVRPRNRTAKKQPLDALPTAIAKSPPR